MKEELWITNFVQILKLDGRKRVSLGNTYCNYVPDVIIVNFIGKWLLNELKQLWNRFFQYIDWWLHSSHHNRGKTHLHCNIWLFSAWNWQNWHQNTCLDLKDLNGTDSKNILACMKQSTAFRLISDDFMSILVGLGTDSTHINAGKDKGKKILIQLESLWMFGQCLTCRLEFVITHLKNLLRQIFYWIWKSVLLCLWYIYLC